jgi:hypothetical protein
MSGAGGSARGLGIRVGYADPPYLGCCGLYQHHHPDGRCWDDPETHRLLIGRLVAEFPDGWVLSCSSPSLRTLLPLCPEDVRVGAWVKPFHAFKRGVRPAYAWEPVVYLGGRNRHHPPPEKGGKATTPRDWVSANITLQKGLTGVKPNPFCFWLFDLLGLRTGDELVDLFPGSGAVSRAWALWQSSLFGAAV